MNKQEVKERIKVMQAYLAGKQIQLSYHSTGAFVDCTAPKFDPTCTYRIKPEPEVIYVNKYGDNRMYAYSDPTKESEELFTDIVWFNKKFIEVIDD